MPVIRTIGDISAHCMSAQHTQMRAHVPHAPNECVGACMHARTRTHILKHIHARMHVGEGMGGREGGREGSRAKSGNHLVY